MGNEDTQHPRYSLKALLTSYSFLSPVEVFSDESSHHTSVGGV